jgi:hypothetical protein
MAAWAVTKGILSVLLPHCLRTALSHRNLLHETLIANLSVAGEWEGRSGGDFEGVGKEG